jgi:lipoate-protein ligase A
MNAELWLDEAHRGSWNMAVDSAMLEYAAAHRVLVLRLYSWSRPTVSLGWFQSYDEFTADARLSELDCVRRVTGGGAILHDREWTYSIAVPESNFAKGHSDSLYRDVHDAVADRLNLAGFSAERWLDTKKPANGVSVDDKTFMCFSRRSDVDLIVKDRKVLGSAQRRTEHGLLQHGSLLLEPSPHYPSLHGLFTESTEPSTLRERNFDRMTYGNQRSEKHISMRIFADTVQRGIDKSMNAAWTTKVIPSECSGRAEQIEREKFGSIEWTISKRITGEFSSDTTRR